jgi:hypothetical protein
MGLSETLETEFRFNLPHLLPRLAFSKVIRSFDLKALRKSLMHCSSSSPSYAAWCGSVGAQKRGSAGEKRKSLNIPKFIAGWWLT